jgi:glycine/D-amino acid oxidase-like deaminating enzyme
MTAKRISINTPIQFNDPLPDAVDTVIIGGGVIGVFAALYLTQMGQRVLICEKGRIAGEQSSRNWGWIRQQGRDAAELPIMTQSLGLWHDINTQTNGETGVVANGVSYLASSEKSMLALEEWLPTAKDHGVDTQMLSSRQVANLFDTPAYPWFGATHTATDARGEPWQAVPAVARLAQSHGTLIRENCAVRGLQMSAGKITAVETESGPVACEQAILAGGAWSALFARTLGVNLPQLSIRATVANTEPMPEFFSGNAADECFALRRRRDGGYTLALGDNHDFFIGPDAFRHFAAYMPLMWDSWRDTHFAAKLPSDFPDSWKTPRKWANTDVTPFEKNRVLEPEPNMKYVALMQSRFAERFPKIGRPIIQNSWAGMIDAMPDVVPVIDRIPTVPGLIVATGMCGHGFGIGPGFGHVIARMATEKPAEHTLTRFRFGRFTDGSKMVLGSSI